MLQLVLAATLVVAGQVDDAAPLPPPPPLSDDAFADPPPPPPLPDVDEAAPPLPDSDEDAPPRRLADDDDAREGEGERADDVGLTSWNLEPLPRGALQALTGFGVLAVLSLFTAVPFIGCYCAAPLIGLLGPLLVAVVETNVGDLVGDTRGALVWPVLGAYGAQVLGAVLTVGLALFTSVAIGGAGSLLANQTFTPDIFVFGYLGGLLVLVMGALLTSIATVVTPAVIYEMTATPKQPGDTEARFAPLFAPAPDMAY